MPTRTKLHIALNTTCVMMLLNVFSKPLRIPETFQWVLIIGVFIPLGLSFYFIKKKIEKQSGSKETVNPPDLDQRQSTKRRLVFMMVLGVAAGLSSPLVMPLTGTTLGLKGDFICGLIASAVICFIFGMKLRKL